MQQSATEKERGRSGQFIKRELLFLCEFIYFDFDMIFEREKNLKHFFTRSTNVFLCQSTEKDLIKIFKSFFFIRIFTHSQNTILDNCRSVDACFFAIEST